MLVVQSLTLHNCHLGRGAFPGVAEMFSTCLERLSIAHNCIGERGGQELAEQLGIRCQSLQCLDMHNNQLGAGGLATMCDRLAGRCTQLVQLHIGCNGIQAGALRDSRGRPDWERLCDALALLSLQLQRLRFGSFEAIHYLEV